MTDVRVKIGEPPDTGFDTDNLDGFIQDMAKRLGTVVKEHWMSYVGEAKALYNDIGMPSHLSFGAISPCHGRLTFLFRADGGSKDQIAANLLSVPSFS